MRHFRYYHYPRKRTAYGTRDRRQRLHVHTAEDFVLSAHELHRIGGAERFGLTFDALSMPQGGQRLVVYCPQCAVRRTRLYASVRYAGYGLPFVCRCCVGLVYWRQYEGRRLETDNGGDLVPERALWAMYQGYRGWRTAVDNWLEREADHDARAWVGLTINQLRLKQMSAYYNLLDELNAAVERRASPYQYYQAKRQSQHTATILKLERRIGRLRRKQPPRYQHQHQQRIAA